MKNKHKIAIIGEAGSGKDFSADYMIRKYGYSRYAFADNVKLLAETWFPDHYGNGGNKPRWLLQAVGTKFREIDEDVWIKAMFEDIKKEREKRKKELLSNEFIIVTDCRMPNEYKALKDSGFTFIRIKSDEGTRINRMKERGDIFNEKDMRHHSESFYDSMECDYEVLNNGSAEELYEAIDNVIDRIKRER